MKFVSIEIQNFLSFGSASLDFPSGLVLIEGVCEGGIGVDSNGAGKTAIFEAILWCLWGKTLRGFKGDDIVNERISRGGTFVHLSLILDGGKDLSVTRYRNHKEFKNSLSVYLSGVDLSGPVAQEQLEQLIGVSFRTFTNSIMFGQTLLHFGDMGDAERKQLLDEILDLEILPKALKEVKSFLRVIEASITEKQTLLQIKKEISVVQKRDLESYTKATTTFFEARKERVVVVEGKIAKVKEALKDYKLQKKSLSSNRKLLLDSNQEVSTQLIELEKVEKKQKKEYKALQSLQAECIRLETLYRKLQEERNGFMNLRTGSQCPTCKNKVTKEHKQSILDKYVQQLEEAHSKSTVKEDKCFVAYNRYKIALATWTTKKKKLTITKQGLDSDITKIEKTLINCTKEIEFLDRQQKEDIKELKEIWEEQNPYKQLISDVKKEQKDLQKVISKLEKQLIEDTQELSLLQFWEWGFGSGGLKSFILDKLTPVLNEIASDIAMSLTGGSLQVKFHTKEKLKSKDEYVEKFGFSVIHPTGSSSYKFSSSGERRRIDLIILLSLQRLIEVFSGFRSSSIFLDEVFDSLDSTGRESIMNVLQEELKSRETVFVITQESTFREHFSQIITVVKDVKGISTIKGCVA